MKSAFLITLIALFSWVSFSQPKYANTNKPKKSPPIDLSRYVLVEGGNYLMGADNSLEPNQKPKHSVTVGDFYIAKNELTMEEYDRYCDSNHLQRPSDSGYGRGKRPAILVSWLDAIHYCNWMSKKEKLSLAYNVKEDVITWIDTATGYRLPTEAEWEYAARGGKLTKGNQYAGSDNINDVCWYRDNSQNMTQPTATKAPNELGLYDMCGNVWEWCWDIYDGGYYATSPSNNPHGANAGNYRSMRGGAWYNVADYATVMVRQNHHSGFKQTSVGFRVARNR